MEAVLGLGLGKVTAQNAYPACLARDSVIAFAQSLAATLGLAKAGPVEHVVAAEVV